jgi:hypothetical protein
LTELWLAPVIFLFSQQQLQSLNGPMGSMALWFRKEWWPMIQAETSCPDLRLILIAGHERAIVAAAVQEFKTRQTEQKSLPGNCRDRPMVPSHGVRSLLIRVPRLRLHLESSAAIRHLPDQLVKAVAPARRRWFFENPERLWRLAKRHGLGRLGT